MPRTTTPNWPSATAGLTGCSRPKELDGFVSALAHRIARFPAAGHALVKERVNAIALAPIEEFRRDSDLSGEGVRTPAAQRLTGAAFEHGYRPESRRWPGRACSTT